MAVSYDEAQFNDTNQLTFMSSMAPAVWYLLVSARSLRANRFEILAVVAIPTSPSPLLPHPAESFRHPSLSQHSLLPRSGLLCTIWTSSSLSNGYNIPALEGRGPPRLPTSLDLESSGEVLHGGLSKEVTGRGATGETSLLGGVTPRISGTCTSKLEHFWIGFSGLTIFLAFCNGGFRDCKTACDRRRLRGEGGGYETPRWLGLSKDFGTVNEWWWWWMEYDGGEESEAAVKFGNDWPDKFGTGICTVSVFGVGDFDKKSRLQSYQEIQIIRLMWSMREWNLLETEPLPLQPWWIRSQGSGIGLCTVAAWFGRYTQGIIRITIIRAQTWASEFLFKTHSTTRYVWSFVHFDWTARRKKSNAITNTKVLHNTIKSANLICIVAIGYSRNTLFLPVWMYEARQLTGTAGATARTSGTQVHHTSALFFLAFATEFRRFLHISHHESISLQAKVTSKIFTSFSKTYLRLNFRFCVKLLSLSDMFKPMTH